VDHAPQCSSARSCGGIIPSQRPGLFPGQDGIPLRARLESACWRLGFHSNDIGPVGEVAHACRKNSNNWTSH